TSTITASPLFSFAPASCGEISVTLFFASATSFLYRACSDIPKHIRGLRRFPQIFRRTPRSGVATAIHLGVRRWRLSVGRFLTHSAALRWDRALRLFARDKSRRKRQRLR